MAFPGVVYVLDVFQKKSMSGKGTPKPDKARVKHMNNRRRTSTARVTARSKAPKRVVFEEGSGNVFADLGLADAEERQAKATLAHMIINIVEDHGWAQKKAAAVLGIAESEMSDIMNGKLRRFSRERLERYLNLLGMEIRIQVYPRPAGKRRAGVSVQLLAAV